MDEANTLFNTDYNYQKIATADTETVAVGSSVPFITIKTVTHGLGYIPSARVWYDPATGRRFPISEEEYTDDTTLTSEVNKVVIKAYLTTTDLVIQCSNRSGSSKNVVLWWRIYYDT